MRDMDLCQAVKSSQDRVGTPKPERNCGQPARNQPRGYKTLLVHRYRGAMKALLSPLAAFPHQEQRSYHSIHRVLVIGNQLDRQQGKRSLPLFAEKTGNRNTLFLELRE